MLWAWCSHRALKPKRQFRLNLTQFLRKMTPSAGWAKAKFIDLDLYHFHW